MSSYLARRLAAGMMTLVAVTLMAFAVAHIAPGDPAAVFLRRTSDAQPTPMQIEAARHELGLDRPFAVQYIDWVGGALRGDFGVSYATRRPVSTELTSRLPATIELAAPAAVLAALIALPGGLVSAHYRNRLPDQLVRLVALGGASMPNFWLALLLIMVFAVRLSFVPVAGRQGLTSMILPIVTLTLAPAAVLTRFARSAVLEELTEDYVRTARAKGVSERRVLVRHAFRNGLIPIATAFALSVGHLLAGAVVVETIFVWPGVGNLALAAILQRDYPVIQAFVVYAGITFIVINFVVDLLYTRIDPRVTLTRTREAAAA